MKKSLFLKIFAGYLVIVLLAVFAMGYLTASHLKGSLTKEMEKELAAFGRIISLMPMADIREKAPSLAKASNTRITLIDATGIVVSDTDQGAVDLDNHYNRPEIREARTRGQGSAIRYSQTLRTDMIYCALALSDGDKIKGYIRLAKPLVELQAASAKLYMMIFQTIIIVLIPSLLIAMVFFFRIVTPIRAIEEYTRKIRAGDSRVMQMIDSQDEIGSLARNINNMVQFQQEKINQIQEQKGKLESTFASMMEGVMVLNGEHIIETVNKSMMNMVGAESINVIGKTPIEVLRNIALQDALNGFLKTGEPVTVEIGIEVDSQVILEVSISDVSGLPGDGRKILMVFHDVTQLRKLETMRTDFVANVTHEIKTPLTAILGFVQTLQQGAINDQTQAARFLGIISANAQRLNRLVDDLLTLSRIELGEVRLRLEMVDAREAVAQAIAVIEGQAKVKGLAIRQNWPDDLPLIRADADSLLQILLNVLDNAVKFTLSGSIAVSISVAEKGYLAITIADSGIGIPKQELARLGERFYRVDKMRSRELGGAGLGLSIVKHLLKVHQGRMEMESQPGKGTTVKLLFPIDV